MEKFMSLVGETLRYEFDSEKIIDLTTVFAFYKLLNDINVDREHVKENYKLKQYSENVNIDKLTKNITFDEFESQLRKATEAFPTFKDMIKPLKKLDEGQFKIIMMSVLDVLRNELNFGEELVRHRYQLIYEKFQEIFKVRESKLGGRDLSIFTTPTPVIEILDKILKVLPSETFMDPCFGIGNLAMKLGENAKETVGYDINRNVVDLGKMLFEIADKDLELQSIDSLEETVKSADVVASHIPFSIRTVKADFCDREYLKWGTPSKTNEDFSFISLVAAKMKKRGAILVPEGDLFRSGAEGSIREKLIKDGLISGVISLPSGILTPYTSIATSIIFFDKEEKKDGVFILDGKEYFKKLVRNISISEESLNRLVEDYKERKEILGVSRVVTIDELERNEYTLNANRYIEIVKNVRNIDVLEKEVKDSLRKAMKSREICDKILDQI